MPDFFMPKQSARNPYFEALLKEGTNTSPIGAHSQGMSRLAFALLAGLERGQMDRDERERREGMAEAPWTGGQPDRRAQPTTPLPSPVEPNPPPAANATTPASPPAQMPLVSGPSGQPVRPPGIVGDPINIFDPRPLTRRPRRGPPPGFRRDRPPPEIID
jgi:hypothetical protein